MNNNLLNYTLQIADNALILGHRISEWCGHGPILEQDIALTNIALDLIGQARSLYQYAAQVEGSGKTEDDLAYLRIETQFKRCQIFPVKKWSKMYESCNLILVSAAA